VKHMILLEAQIKESFLSVVEGNSTPENEILLGNLEKERNKILFYNEEKWRQRSRAIWIKSGDSNTIFFHNFTSQRRKHNYIRKITDEFGVHCKGQEDLKKAVTHYFNFFYKERLTSCTMEKLEVTNLFKKMIQNEDLISLLKPVTTEEIKKVLDLFKRDKSPGLDGWMVEFFSHFFDLVSEDLVQVVEESRKFGNIPGCLNSTFLTLIPKENNPSSFGDFRPISLCNLCYKMISKVISNRIKPYLSSQLS